MRASKNKGRALLSIVVALVFIPVFWAAPSAVADPCVSSYDAQTIAANLAATTDVRVTSLTSCAGDDVSYQVPLTASVMFDGHAYTNVYATTNSVITFGAPDGTYWDYPSTPSISLYSMDWLAIPAIHPDEHLIIQASNGGFQVDLSARPYGNYGVAEATNIVITAAINVDGTVAISFATSGPTYDYARTGVRLTDGSVVSLADYGVVQVAVAPVLAPTPEPVPTVEPSPTPTVEPLPTPEPTNTPAPVESPSSEPTATPEPIPAPVTQDTRTEDVRTEDVRPVDPIIPPVVPVEPVVPIEPTPAVEPTPVPAIEPPVEPLPVPVDSSPAVVPETPAEPAPEPAPIPEPAPVPEPVEPTPTPSVPSEETTPTTPEVTPQPQPTPKTPQTPTPTVVVPPTPKPVEQPPVEQPKLSTPSVPSLPDNATPEQVAVAIEGANAVLATADPESAEYQQALDLLAEAATTDDPQVPETLASIPGVGPVAVAVLNAFNSLGNLGADISPKVRKKMKEVGSAVIVVGIAMSSGIRRFK